MKGGQMFLRDCGRPAFPIGFVGAILIFGLTVVPEIACAVSLTELIAKAKQEGTLNATVTSSMTGKTTPKLIAAFNKHFGLNLAITLTPVNDTVNYPRALAAAQSGAPPTYDAIEGTELNNVQLLDADGLHKVEGWESLVAEINSFVRSGKVKPSQISPGQLSGYAFAYMTRSKSLIYNPRLIAKANLPRTHSDLADAKYKGMWTQPPWTSHWDIGPFVFPDIGREKWLEIVRAAGKNAGAVLNEQAGVERVMLGEYAFAPANTYYAFLAKSKDPQAPVEVTFFKDYNQANATYYVVNKGTKRPAAATLFAIWMGTAEAKALWQSELFGTQYRWGESELDKKERALIQESGANMVDLFESEKGREYLKWFSTQQGREYRKSLSQAIRGQ
jgi:ABC-type Fe3+ transport system substrate-binding protein